MKLILLLILFESANAVVDGQFDFSNDFDRCVTTVENLVTGSDANAGVCEMYQGFVNISIICSGQMTAAQNSVLQALISDIKSALAVAGLTSEQKVFKVGELVEVFKQQHSDVYDIIQYQNISSWSSVNTLTYVVIVQQQQYIQTAVTLTSNGSSPYLDAIRAAAKATGDSSCITAVEDLIQNTLVPVSCNADISFIGRISVLNLKVEDLFSTCSALETQLQTQEISNFGSFLQFSNIATAYKQSASKALAVTGTFPDIPVINYLQAALNDWIVKDINVAIQLNQFIARINQTFQTMTDPTQRAEFLADYTYEFMVYDYNFTTNCLYGISFGSYGTLSDYIFYSDFTPASQVGSVSTCPTTTTSTTSTTTTTELSTTTTILSTTAPNWYVCACTCP